MSVSIIYDEPRGIACFFDNNKLTAFHHAFIGKFHFGAVCLQANEYAAIVLSKIAPVDVRGLNPQEMQACIQGVEEWIMAQIRLGYTDPDDLERMARTGDKPCKECGEWFTPLGNDHLCGECWHEAQMLDMAERKGDLEREEA